MLKGILLASALSICLAMPARADTNVAQRSVSVATQTQLADTVYGVESSHRSAAGVIVGDAIGGAALGALAGGGVAAYRNYVQNEGWGNWQRDVLIGAGIGLGVGLVFGLVDAAGNADRTNFGPVADQRQTGFSAPLAQRGVRF